MTNKPKKYHYRRNDICRNCHGQKKVTTSEYLGHGRYAESTEICPVCQGVGMVEISKEITVTIKPLRAVFPVNNV